MATLRCPYCHPRPLRLARRSDGALVCGSCGDPLVRVPLVRPLPALAGLLVMGGIGLTLLAQHLSVSQMVQAPALASPETGLEPSPSVRQQDYPLAPQREQLLFSQLDAADRSWMPRAEPIPGGGTRYIYRRLSTDPPLSVAEIKALMRNPPSFEVERGAIAALLRELHRRGVTVVLGPPRKQGAAGEWEPRAAVLRIRPDVPAKGSREFVRVLNHEAIHVAQSCRGGGLRSRPAPLGLPRELDPLSQHHLAAPIYATASVRERTLEEEAYANQGHLSLGLQLLQAHCRGTWG